MDLNHTEEATPGAPGAPEEMSPLDRIALEALGGEQAQQEAEDRILHGDPEPEPVIDPALAWGQVAMMFGGILGMAMPELKSVYTEQACMDWGGGMAQVAAKYGWEADETIAKFGPECALAIASFPLVAGTVVAIKSRQAASKAKNLNEPPSRAGNGVAGPNNAPNEPFNPMTMEPGGFSEPT